MDDGYLLSRHDEGGSGGFRQHFPAPPFASFRGYVWALALLGPTRKWMTKIARRGGFVARHLASWEGFLSGAPGALRAVSQQLVTPWRQPVGSSLCLWEALRAAVDTTLIPNVRGPRPGVQKWHDHSGHPARGESLVGPHGALSGLVASWGAGDLCWPVLARWLPGQLKPLGVVAAPDGVQRLAFWWVVVALVRERPQWVGARPLRVVAVAYFSQAAFLNPWVAAGITGISRRRKDAVGWDHPAPGVGKRPRGRPRQQGRICNLARLRAVAPVTERTVVIYGQEARVGVGWRDGWLRDLTSTVRVVALATKGTPLLWVSTDRTLSAAVMIQLSAARFSLELTRRNLQQSRGVGDDQCQRLLAIHRFVPLALTACCLWRLTRRPDQRAPWLTTAPSTAAGALTPLGCQRLHHALRRRVLQRIFTAAAAAADAQTTEARYEQIFRIVA